MSTQTNGRISFNNPARICLNVFLITSLLAAGACTVTPKKKNRADINNNTKFSSKVYGVKASKRVTTSKKVRKGGGRYQIGKPYKIKGKWYHPKEQPNYNKTGMASWYGPNFHGRLTANGEIYDQYSLSAAHPTLPLPSYARVTNLENGRSVIVRVNDRGPFSSKRIIDLSAQASKMLGYQKQGLAKVRVKYVGKARMDGLDARYLMASYSSRDGKFNKPGLFAPGTMIASTMLAGLKPPASTVSLNSPFNNNHNQPPSTQSQMALNTVPVPALRPALLNNGIMLDLTSSHAFDKTILAPLGYAGSTGFDRRVQQTFSVINLYAPAKQIVLKSN